MLFTYINNIDRTADVTAGSIKKVDQLQQRADSLDFKIFQGNQPNENENLQMYIGDIIAGASGVTIDLKGYFTRNLNIFYKGQILDIRIGEIDQEEVIVQSYDEDSLQIILESSPIASISVGDKIGFIKFGGVVSRSQNTNIGVLANLEYIIEGVDYSKIFDKELISNTWQDRDSRYIINDFCNTTINYGKLFDDMEYSDNTAIQTQWAESDDGNNPTIDISDPREGDTHGVFSWTHATGTAKYESILSSSINIADLTGVSSGTPTNGHLVVQYKVNDYSNISSIDLSIGSDSSNYRTYEITPTNNEYNVAYIKLDDPISITGTPDWTVFDYMKMLANETADDQIEISSIRILQDNYFDYFTYVEETPEFADIRSPQLKPMAFMQLLGKAWNYNWYLDYKRRIHFFSRETNPAPFCLSDNSNNFTDLNIDTDQSQLGNRIIVRGGSKLSDNKTAQVKKGDETQREWLLQKEFSSLSILVDDNTSTSSAEVGTTSTNITITGHGLTAGDHLINRTRSNAVREVISVVDANNVTVLDVTSQTTSDTISFFTISKTIGIEGITDESTVDYVSNSDEKTIRATDSELSLSSSEYIRFEYYEKIPIQFQYSDPASINALKSLGFGNGIFDLDPYTDKNISDVGSALAIAQAKVREYANAIIKGGFQTDYHGLRSGQIINVSDTVRGIDQSFLIQKVSAREIKSEYGDYFRYTITFGSTLYGIIEFFQKLLSAQDKLELNTDEVVQTFISSNETIECSEVNTVAKGGIKTVSVAETIECSEVNTVALTSGWKWEGSTGQDLETRWDLFSWG